jgi:hypothetical protein
MCISSFVVSGSQLIVTFNHDEDITRKFHAPEMDAETGIFCPRDEVAGGTWIGFNGNYIMCIRNGGRSKHQRNAPYQQSRGIMLREMLKTNRVESLLSELQNIKTEPFTLNVVNTASHGLSIYYYDGLRIEQEILELDQPKLGLSSTSYDINMSSAIISDFMQLRVLTPASILGFHREHIIPMPVDRFAKALATTSITQFVLSGKKGNCIFVDLIDHKTYHYDL